MIRRRPRARPACAELCVLESPESVQHTFRTMRYVYLRLYVYSCLYVCIYLYVYVLHGEEVHNRQWSWPRQNVGIRLICVCMCVCVCVCLCAHAWVSVYENSSSARHLKRAMRSLTRRLCRHGAPTYACTHLLH